MAIIRKQYFTTSNQQDSNDIELIDTPEKLVRFAELRGLSIIPLDVEGVAKQFGIHVEYVSMKEDMSGSLDLEREKESKTWVIRINKDHHPNRQRYSIAHELGHFCLHKHLSHFFEDDIFFRGGELSKEEWQANEFAGAILMPEQIFREKVRSGTRNIEDLSKEFKVSSLALRIRAKSLGMSGHGL
jgi:Zn-dependent peptidase ImmA (M78 family)